MKNSFVVDTMAVVLFLEERHLSRKIKSIFEDAEIGEINLHIPAIVLAEIGYLSEKNKIDINLEAVRSYCQENSSIKIEPITQEVTFSSFEIDDIPELHDRIIAGTARYKNFKLITNDPIIAKSGHLSTIW